MYRTESDLSSNPRFLDGLRSLYGEAFAREIPRYQDLAARAAARKHGLVSCFSIPGRTELAGNHTDHSQGRVLAAAIDVDLAAVVAHRQDSRVHFHWAGQEPVDMDLDNLVADRGERGTVPAIIRGVASRLKAQGHRIGGFEAFAHSVEPHHSELLSGGIENLVVNVFNHLFNDGRLTVTEQALVGQYAKNRFYGKPCGLMDQITCGSGGVVAVDFADPQAPLVETIDFDLGQVDLSLLAVDSGGDRKAFAEDYAAIAWEMKLVAAALGVESCRALDEATLLARIPELRPLVGDRPILRTLHYLDENARVDAQVAALREGRFPAFLALVRESSLSSFMWLQNIISPTHVGNQGVTLALALTERFIKAHGGRGACRIHGGGFAGTIQAWIPTDQVEAYRAALEPLFPATAVQVLRVRRRGATAF
jgi:galactokinase